MTEGEIQITETFFLKYFDDTKEQRIDQSEIDVITECLEYVDLRFSRMKYILGLAIDFCLLAQVLSRYDKFLSLFHKDLGLDALFERYRLVTERGSRKANTLTLEYHDQIVGIRKLEEDVLNLFHALNRTEYPSAYVYNTGQWQKYQDLLTLCFQLSTQGRLILCKKLVGYGLDKLSNNIYYSREKHRVRLFERTISDFLRGEGENGGLIFQALAYGYYYSDFPHLNLVVDKVRTGSSRQKRFGDIDCYFGLDLEISVEVKDFELTESNYERELANLMINVSSNKCIGVIFAKEVSEKIRSLLAIKEIRLITEQELLHRVSFWDWQKQNNALHGVLHYLAHIEQDAKAVRRLLQFIFENDPEHDSLVYNI